ncbi:MAG: hypothetical protein Q4G19_01460 [Clostridia bacterium]|nr:hypothetical protein [Clostridia bacterium]
MKNRVRICIAGIFVICLLCSGIIAAAENLEPASAGNGLMPYDDVLRLIRWIDDGYYRNRTYEEVVAFTGVEGLDKGHRDTGMTALGDHYFDWIAESDATHYIHVCFRGRDDSGRFEACQWNTSGFNSAEWAGADLTDWLAETACRETEPVSVQIQRFSNPAVTVSVRMPVTGWRIKESSSNSVYFYNERGEDQNDPRIEVVTFDTPDMLDFYKDKWENLQPADSRVIAGVEMTGRTYHHTGWDWLEYDARLSEHVSVGVRISRINCGEGTEGAALLDSLQLSWTETDGTVYTFPGSVPVSAAVTEEPIPEATPEPAPQMTEAPAPVITAEPILTDEYHPEDPIVFIPAAKDRPDYWQEYTFTHPENGVSLSFCVPMDPEKGVDEFYEYKEPRLNSGRAFFDWCYNRQEAKKTSYTTRLYVTDKYWEINSHTAHGHGEDDTYTTVKTDRGITLYRHVNYRGEVDWAIISEPLSDGSRVLIDVDANHSGHADRPWYQEILKAFEETVTLTVPGEDLTAAAAQPAVTETPAPTEAPTAPPAAETPVQTLPAMTAGDDDYAGIWYGTWMHTGGMDGDPRKLFGMTIILTLNADGTGDFDYFGSDGGGRWGTDEEGVTRYWGDGTPLSFLEDGSLCWGSYLSGYILFSRDQAAEASVFPADPAAQIISAPASAPTAETQPGTSGDAGAGDFVGVRYTASTYIAGGVSMDASVLGGEYSILLNADGSAVFTMAGMEMPGYTWKRSDERIEVDAYGTVVITMTPETDGSMTLDYMGAMTLIMVP